jgi:septal ring factor EnvC (AmiA/AmiB activator)
MNDEERQRQMDFIVQQQAKFTTQLNSLTERVDAIAGKVDAIADTQQRAEKRWEETEKGIRALLAIAELHEQEIRAHDLLSSANARQIAANTRHIAELREAGRETNERVNALINTVERLISERRDGGPQEG